MPFEPGRPPRVVLDTALVLSALLFGGGDGARLRHAWQAGYCRPLLSAATLNALAAALAAPALRLSRAEQMRLMEDYLPHVLHVRMPEAAGEAADLAHGDDDPPPALALVRLALAGGAHALVAADADLLALGGRLACPVMALAPFLARLDCSAITPRPMSV